MLNIVFETHPNISMMVLPLLVMHPMQIMLGSAFSSRFHQYIVDADARRTYEALEEG